MNKVKLFLSLFLGIVVTSPLFASSQSSRLLFDDARYFETPWGQRVYFFDSTHKGNNLKQINDILNAAKHVNALLLIETKGCGNLEVKSKNRNIPFKDVEVRSEIEWIKNADFYDLGRFAQELVRLYEKTEKKVTRYCTEKCDKRIKQFYVDSLKNDEESPDGIKYSDEFKKISEAVQKHKNFDVYGKNEKIGQLIYQKIKFDEDRLFESLQKLNEYKKIKNKEERDEIFKRKKIGYIFDLISVNIPAPWVDIKVVRQIFKNTRCYKDFFVCAGGFHCDNVIRLFSELGVRKGFPVHSGIDDLKENFFEYLPDWFSSRDVEKQSLVNNYSVSIKRNELAQIVKPGFSDSESPFQVQIIGRKRKIDINETGLALSILKPPTKKRKVE